MTEVDVSSSGSDFAGGKSTCVESTIEEVLFVVNAGAITISVGLFGGGTAVTV